MANDFYLFANCNFVPDKYNDWQAAYDSLAEYVWTSEPRTKTYYFGIPIDYSHDFSKTTSMFAFEVYSSREALYGENGHLSSPAMAKFLQQIPAASTTGLDLNHYRLVAGFLDRLGTQASVEVMQDIRITCVSPSARESLLSSLSSLVASVERAGSTDSGGESGVLTYMAFASVDDETGVRIFGRWATRAGMEGFIRGEGVVGFWMANKENVRAMEQRLYVPNRKGWLHRGRGSGYAGEQEQEKGLKAKI